MKTITLTVHNRPDNLIKVLDNLKKNKLYDFSLYIGLEPGNDECVKVCENINFIKTTIVRNIKVLGVRHNPYNILDCVFNLGSEINIYLEDDLEISPDICDLSIWYYKQLNCNKIFNMDILCLNLFSWNNGDDPRCIMLKNNGFCPWGMCITKYQWDNYFKPIWFNDNHSLNGKGWDFSVQSLLNPKLFIAYPYISRSNHVGIEGVHSTRDIYESSFKDRKINTSMDISDYYIDI
ncbi:MAG: hypothetical protein AABY32_02495 [Nanoarchaeota archaeon]